MVIGYLLLVFLGITTSVYSDVILAPGASSTEGSVLQGVSKEIMATDPLRLELETSFAADIAFISRIINEGEKDEKERTQFGSIFTNQLNWFQNTLQKSKSNDDESFKSVLRKKEIIESIVKHQKKLDKKITELATKNALNEETKARVRLNVLYDLNMRLQISEKKECTVADLREILKSAFVKVGKSVDVIDEEIGSDLVSSGTAAAVASEVKAIKDEVSLLKQKSVLEENLAQKLLAHQYKLQSDECEQKIAKTQQEKSELEKRLQRETQEKQQLQMSSEVNQKSLKRWQDEIARIKAEKNQMEIAFKQAIQKASYEKKAVEEMSKQDSLMAKKKIKRLEGELEGVKQTADGAYKIGEARTNSAVQLYEKKIAELQEKLVAAEETSKAFELQKIDSRVEPLPEKQPLIELSQKGADLQAHEQALQAFENKVVVVENKQATQTSLVPQEGMVSLATASESEKISPVKTVSVHEREAENKEKLKNLLLAMKRS